MSLLKKNVLFFNQSGPKFTQVTKTFRSPTPKSSLSFLHSCPVSDLSSKMWFLSQWPYIFLVCHCKVSLDLIWRYYKKWGPKMWVWMTADHDTFHYERTLFLHDCTMAARKFSSFDRKNKGKRKEIIRFLHTRQDLVPGIYFPLWAKKDQNSRVGLVYKVS